MLMIGEGTLSTRKGTKKQTLLSSGFGKYVYRFPVM